MLLKSVPKMYFFESMNSSAGSYPSWATTRSTSPAASSSPNTQCLRTMSVAAQMTRLRREAAATEPLSAAIRLAAGNTVSLLLVTRNPCPESHQAAGDAALMPGRLSWHRSFCRIPR